jgi:hypothetical protein
MNIGSEEGNVEDSDREARLVSLGLELCYVS